MCRAWWLEGEGLLQVRLSGDVLLIQLNPLVGDSYRDGQLTNTDVLGESKNLDALRRRLHEGYNHVVGPPE